MKFTKLLSFLFIFLAYLHANEVVYIDSNNEATIKDEFFSQNSKKFTISIATLNVGKDDPIEFFKKYQMKKALAYKYGDNNEFFRVISGIYSSFDEASLGIKSLDTRLQKNRPYVAKLVRHQNLFNEYNNKEAKAIQQATKKTKVKKSSEIVEKKGSIYTTNEEEALLLKKQFLNKESNYYSIALGSISLDKNSIQNFFETYDVGDKALAHVYGENKDKVRIIYGLYKTKEEAKQALKDLNERLKENSPYASKMKRFQKFYNRFYPQGIDDETIVKLQMNEEKKEEKKVVPKLDENIKVVEKKEPKKKTELKVEKPNIKKPITEKQKEPKKQNKKIEKKPVKAKKVDPNKNRFLKYSMLEDVYYIEKSGDFNILNEVFLKEGSSFYTVDLGELKLQETSIEEFFIKNGMDSSALAYKYGDNNEYARAIYGAYETKEEANIVATKLNIQNDEEIRVSNIKNHQKLYKLYHKDGFKTKTTNNQKSVSSPQKLNDEILFVETNNKNRITEEFFDRNSQKFTITLITYEIGNLNLYRFLEKNNLEDEVLIYPMGEQKSYHRVLYGLYNSSNEAKNAIENLNQNLRNNIPFVSRIKTNQRKFESYYSRKLENFVSKINRLELK